MFRIGTGVIILCGGLGLLYLGFTMTSVLYIHGGVAVAIGLAIILNTREDSIEEINESKK